MRLEMMGFVIFSHQQSFDSFGCVSSSVVVVIIATVVVVVTTPATAQGFRSGGGGGREPCGQEGVLSWIKDQFREQCSKKWIINDFSGLEYELKTKLHGQHIASRMVANSIRGHLENSNPPKALSLSLHGSTGIGKTYVSEMIARRLYRNGMNSKFVKRFYGQTDFPDDRLTAHYRNFIRSEIQSCSSACCQCLFIFDEIDKMPPGIFDELKGYFDHYSSLHGISYRRNIFLFVSNIGSKKLTEFLLTNWRDGRPRESLGLNEIEPYLRDAVYNTDGGLRHSALIEHNLLGTFVPFLPLERDHVKQCVRDLVGYNRATEERVTRVADSIAYYPEDLKLFAKTGCTSVLEKYFQHDEF